MNKVLSLLFVLLVFAACGCAQAQTTLQLKFAAYDTQSDGSYRLQVNGFEVRVPSVYYPEQDHTVRGTHYQVAEFHRKDLWVGGRPNGKRTDISELVLVHAKTGRKVTLVLGETVDIPTPDGPVPRFK